MKVRNGFVSNSSSSSFIVAFPHAPVSQEDMQAMLFGEEKFYPNPYIWGDKDAYGWPVEEVSAVVWNDFNASGPVTRDAACEEAAQGHVDGIQEPKYPDWRRDETPEQRMAEYDRYANELDAANKAAAAEFLTRVPENFVLAIFEYSDNDGPFFTALEHGVLFNKVPHLRVSKH